MHTRKILFRLAVEIVRHLRNHFQTHHVGFESKGEADGVFQGKMVFAFLPSEKPT